jgi:glycosyltransferase involved in cell wall biosynthesis
MKIAFHSNQLNLRGTEIALFDYAFYNETILGNSSIIVTKAKGNHAPEVIEKFKSHFKVLFYNTLPELESFLWEEQAVAMYAIKSGENDGLLPNNVKNWVHTVFRKSDSHGNVYAYISEWLAKDQGSTLFVPHIVTKPHSTTENLRAKLGIPENAIVFGRYGGADTFDIRFARKAVLEVAYKNPDKYFIFMGTNEFSFSNGLYRKKWQDSLFALGKPNTLPKNIIFLPATANAEEKQLFINTSDVMLHARDQGETFGLAIAEFSISNKPVITYAANSPKYEAAHLMALGTKAIGYTNEKELKKILLNFKPEPKAQWNAYAAYSPELVMAKFKSVFIDSLGY